MQVTVKLFAALRERADWSQREIELPPGAVLGDVWPALALGDEPPGVAYARNREYAGRDVSLADGDEIALIPPVSGGTFSVRSGPLDLAELVAEVSDPAAGAIATFIGTTRDHSRGRTVTLLEYDAYPEMAEAEMARIGDLVKERHGVTRVAIAHRTGIVPIGEASVMIAVSAPHRAAALDACRDAIDTLKQTVPIWKKEVFEGGEEWIGREGSEPGEPL
jgi:molybdopterin synthase catalytic subunit